MAVSSPRDKFCGVWLIFFMLGLGTLLPWNFFMTATMYFTSRLKNPTSVTSETNLTEGAREQHSVLEAKFNNVMTVCAMVPLLVFTCLTSFMHSLIPQKLRVMGSLVVILAVFMVTAFLVKVELEPLPFFSVTMVTIVIINSFGAVLQGSLFGMAGVLPASYTTPIMSGQGLAGSFAAFAMICAIASGSELQDAAFGYFITACAVISLSLLSYVMLPKLEFFQFFQDRNKQRSGEDNSLTLMQKEKQQDDEESKQEKQQNVSMMEIFKKIWVLALSVCFAFTVTIGTFPAITADAKSTVADGGSWEMYFIPVSCFLLFNLCDWGGRSLTAVCIRRRTVFCYRSSSPLAWPLSLSSCCVTFSPATTCPSSSTMMPGSSSSWSSSPSLTVTWPASVCALDQRKSSQMRRRRPEPSWRSSCPLVWHLGLRCPSSSEHWFNWN
ncbi:equilibrative nucleoside transporter 1-like isoform X1 [Genypterus blacodes]|uniref:equilibrative nucleoside transporter 1-like isoform X1 n=1 Tax=Genypterus blacodes TaxID=154954 RepID=UPI003F757D34